MEGAVNWERGLQRIVIVCSFAVLVLGIVHDAQTMTEYQRAEVTFRDGRRYTVVLPHLRQLARREVGTVWLYPYRGEWSKDKLAEVETRIYGSSRYKILTDQGDLGPVSQEKLDTVVSRVSKLFEDPKLKQEFGGLIVPMNRSKRETRAQKFKLLSIPLGEPEDFLFNQIAAELVTTHTVPLEPERAITLVWHGYVVGSWAAKVPSPTAQPTQEQIAQAKKRTLDYLLAMIPAARKFHEEDRKMRENRRRKGLPENFEEEELARELLDDETKAIDYHLELKEPPPTVEDLKVRFEDVSDENRSVIVGMQIVRIKLL